MRVKNICLYKPTMISERKLKYRRKTTGFGSNYSSTQEPNREMYELIREHSTLQQSEPSINVEPVRRNEGHLPQIIKRKTSVTSHAGRPNYNTINEAPNREATPEGSQKKEGGISIIAKKRPPALNIGYNDYGIETGRVVLYRNFHEISQKIYLVEISRSKT